MVNIKKRGNVYQYQFEIAPVNGTRKYINKSGFKSKREAMEAGIKAYWLKNYCYVNLKYHTIQAYSNIIKNHIKPRLGFYRLSQIQTSTLQEVVNAIYIEKAFSKNFMHNILKVLKGSFKYANESAQFIKDNPAVKVTMPKYDEQEKDPAHIFTAEEIKMILERFRNNHAMYYAILTAYYTGLRVSEVFGLTWEDIDFENKTLTVNKNVLKKNQSGATHGRHISGKATTVWYFETCKTKSSYRTIKIGDTLLNALKEYKEEQERDKIEYGDLYMKHYTKETSNYYNHKPETKIINAFSELQVALPEVHLVFVKHNRGFLVNHKTVQRLMKELGIQCFVRAKKYRSYKGTIGKVCKNLLNRDFKAEMPNQKWVTDVSEFKVNGIKTYLSPIIDLFNGEVISYNLSRHPVFAQVKDMILKAFNKIPNNTNLILHSDQGWQYQMKEYQALLNDKGIRQSMSRKGNCLDNSLAENFFGLLKSELFYLNNYDNIETLEKDIKDYIDYYNNNRIKVKLNGMSPVQFRIHSMGQVA